MSAASNTLTWSARLQVAPLTSKLHGDKITLPPSALEALLRAAPTVAIQNNTSQPLTTSFDPFNPYTFAAERYAREQLAEQQQQLPHPLMFKIINLETGRFVYAGIREFSADENKIELSEFLQVELGIQDTTATNGTSEDRREDDEIGVKNEIPTVTVHFTELPRGTYVRLRPLEAGYDTEDWKSLLERYLRDNFTTLTNGEILVVPGPRHAQFRFLIDKFEPEGDGICVVDTDLEVDIEALNEEQARETLNRKLAKSQRAPGTTEGSSAGGQIEVDQQIHGQVSSGEYVDYEVKAWDRSLALVVNMDTEAEIPIDLFSSPLSARQRSKPREVEHLFGDFGSRALKRLKIAPTNVDIEEAESLYISVHAWRGDNELADSTSHPLTYRLSISQSADSADLQTMNTLHNVATDEVVCKNCHQSVPKRTLQLHEAYCYRNNILCPKCENVFQKSSNAWKNHWHCPHDSEYGSSLVSQAHHNTIFHPSSPLQCAGCDFQAYNLPILAHHRTTVCPTKEILCQFCHLVVSQQGPDDPPFTDAEVLLSGLTPHELTDGARTTECHLCNKIVRLRDMKTHLRLHDRERLLRPTPKLCVNRMCGRTIKPADKNRVNTEQFGLCNECFGPLYISTYDPEGKALRRRIERRLLNQLIGGCSKHWCHNTDWCKTAYSNEKGVERNLSTKDAFPLVKPVTEQLDRGESKGLSFCVDEASQKRRRLAELIAAEGNYELAWCVKALEEGNADLAAARAWLEDWAPKVGEVAR